MDEALIQSVKPAPILVAGDVMVDEYIIGEVERISPEAPVPVLIVRDRLRCLGGAGNVVQNLVSLGGGVALFAALGKDEAGDWFKRQCEAMAVESFWLKETAIRPTTIKTRVVARNQQIVRIDEEQVGSIPAEIESTLAGDARSVVPQVRAVILSDYGKGFLTPHILKTIIQRAREANIPVLVDPKGLDYSRYWGATYITPNLKEASLASGIIIRDEETLLEAGRLLLEQTHAEGLVVTRGREGSTLITRDSMQDFPVKPVEIIDVTGAGDTVIAALALCVANGLSIEDSVRVANLAATLVVTRFGAASVTLREMADAVAEQAQTAKVVTQKDISRLLSSRRIQGARVVFTNGCFDIFHAGHLKSLSEAAKLGDILVVGINSDASVTRIKGPERPVMSRQDRVDLVSALSFVDYVVVFEEDTPLELIEEVRPDILVKGEDWEGKHVVGEDIVRGRGGRVAFIKHVEGISTSDLIKRIRGE